MGQRLIKFSDFSQLEITPETSARIMLTYNEPGNTVAVVADAALDDDVVKQIEQQGKAQVRRGRRTQQAASVE
jgi:hypothetical protein